VTALRATFRHARAEEYARPGGAWDLPSLDALLTDAAASCDTTMLDRVARLAGGLRAAGV
jgi:hypothetical protein